MNIDGTHCARRRDRLRELLRRQDLGALLISHPANRYYLSGFELHNPQEGESAGMLLVTVDGIDLLHTDPRYRDSALRLWPENNLRLYRADAPETIARSVSALSVASLGIESEHISLDFHDRFRQALPATVDMRRTEDLVESLRRVKSDREIARMEAACSLNHAMMRWLPSVALPGRTEQEVAWEIEKFFRERGASELAFPTIAGCGPNAALPHCVPGNDRLREEELLLIDAGCRVQDYCSDQTRVFWLGRHPTPRFRQTLAAVQEAQRLAINMIRPGVECRDVFRTALDHFAGLGLDHAFTHGLGHGVGLQTHESPSLNGRTSTVLEPGMVITVEPGLYDPAWGGIRWEHMVLVTPDGCRVL
jgi:Xaa-Pro aminopeptidase